MAASGKKDSFWVKLATFIVDKRNAFFVLFILFSIYSALSMNKVVVNNDITFYLNENTETKIGMDLMNKHFTTYGSARVMVCNITYAEAEKLAGELGKLDGVSMVDFGEGEKYYHDMEALFNVTFGCTAKDVNAQSYLDGVLDYLEDYDVYYISDIGQEERDAEDLDGDMLTIFIIAGGIIIVVLLVTSRTYAEIPIFLTVFGVAALLNMGTNHWFEQISFITNSIAAVLQLALAVDYAIILCHRFMEERETRNARESAIIALSKAIPEISSSSLTTVAGMVALMLMQFKIGLDMGMVLTKAILFSMLSVFFLMPGLLVVFSRAIDKTHHKNFVPKVNFIGKFCLSTRKVVPPLFVIVLVAAAIISGKAQYAYDVNSLDLAGMSENRFSMEMVKQEFGNPNNLAVIVPAGNYEKERKLLNELEELDYVTTAMGLANVEAMNGYGLTDALSAREFSELIEMDVEVVELLYAAYALDQSNVGALVEGIESYKIPLIDFFMFICDQKEKGNITLEGDMEEMLDTLQTSLGIAKDQLQSEKYSRLALELDLPFEGEYTYEKLEEIRSVVLRYYDETYLVGNSTSDRDLHEAFTLDNTVITVFTALFVMIILLFTFQSAGLPILLVMTIQGSIWINFSIPAMTGDKVYFLGYLIVSAIQMGATIDYAIVLTSRYMELKEKMNIKKAIIETINQAFPTILTSGTMLSSAGFVINEVSSNAVVASLGLTLGRGSLTSIILVLLVLPQILILGDILIRKTAFKLVKETNKTLPVSGKVLVNGRIKGYVNGVIEGDFTGIIDGEMGATVRAKDTVEVVNADEVVTENATEVDGNEK